MRNALLSPVSSQFYNIGNNEVQTPCLDVLTQMENKGDVHGDTFSLESKIYNNDNQLRDGAFVIPYQSHINSHLQDYQCGSSNCDNNFQQSMSLSNKLAIPLFEPDIQNLQNGRKRGIEVNNDQKPLNGTDSLNEWKNNKRKKLSSFEQQQPHQITESLTDIKDCRLHMPVRRSQRLSDKITALQKLVSPYGKTDTASVLQEAALYIKLLQEQIQNLFQMLSSSYTSLRAIHRQEIGKKLQDLRSRGLCLVPISFTQQVTKEDKIDTNYISRKTIIPRNF
ncbi:transcription factor bHLH103-like [Durio zibethinus]|uniref:Transcription factor bHLH103-like n=1 Tax=Durio zibethinus TaxID=66656 RepID=A0A6P6AIB8_DURZI|nr:transcription factor bHLH103-like [Durio zibethinus]